MKKRSKIEKMWDEGEPAEVIVSPNLTFRIEKEDGSYHIHDRENCTIYSANEIVVQIRAVDICAQEEQDERRRKLESHWLPRIHLEVPWSQDHREFGCPLRINIHTKRWFIMVGYGPGSGSQIWTRKEGNTSRWRRVTWSPHRWLMCGEPATGASFESICSRLKGHEGAHSDYSWMPKRLK